MSGLKKMNKSIPFDVNETHCPVCGSCQIKHFSNAKHKEVKLSYDICKNCGIIFMNPHPTEEWYDIFYKQYYRSFYSDPISPTPDEKVKQRKRARTLLQFLKKDIYGERYHLDIGCSTGEFSQALKSEYPISRSVGVEPDQTYRQSAESLGIKCYDNLSSVSNDKQSFTLISMNHVLEHILKPSQFLSNLKKDLLERGGLVYIEVPNYAGLFGSFEIAHPIVFTEESLENTLKLAGFKIIECKSHGNPKSNNNNSKYYTSVLITPQKNKLQVMTPRYVTRIWAFKLASWKNSTLENNLVFLLKFPIRLLRHFGFPKHTIG